jgi:hypothetical protein
MGVRRNAFIHTDNYRARVLKPLAMKLGLAKLNFQVSTPHNGDARPDQRERQRRAGDPGTQQSRHDRERLHADDRG